MENKGITKWIEKHILPLANKIARNKYLKSIQSSFLSAMPLMMIGSFALIIAEPPMDYTTMEAGSLLYGFFKGWAGLAAAVGGPLNFLFDVTLGSLAIYVALGIGYFLSVHYKIQPYTPTITTLITFLLFNTDYVEGGFSNSYFGGTGLFSAMIVAIITVEFYRFLIQHKVGSIKMPDSVPPALAASFEALVPIAIISLVATFFTSLVKNVSGVILPELVLSLITPLIKFIDNVFGVTIVSVLQQVLWWFGIHDTAIGAVLSPIRDSNFAMNAAAYAAGTSAKDLPFVFCSPYWWVFVTIGGAGATFALAALLLTSKSTQLKTVGKIGIVPAFFNINEPVLFGLPIVLNPLMLFPFIVAQTLNAIITYICMSGGIISRCFVEPGWNLFAPIGAFLATMDFKAVILVVLLIIMDAVIYYPFFKVYDNKVYKEEQEGISE